MNLSSLLKLTPNGSASWYLVLLACSSGCMSGGNAQPGMPAYTQSGGSAAGTVQSPATYQQLARQSIQPQWGENQVAGQASLGAPVVRAQSLTNESAGSEQYTRKPLPVSGSGPNGAVAQVAQGPGTGATPLVEGENGLPNWPTLENPLLNPNGPAQPPLPGTPADIMVGVQEARTGRFMFGVGVNSDAGVTGQVVIDERNFDLFRWPSSFQDIMEGTAFRGAGQGFRIEAVPGDQVQRYVVSFTEPYLFSTPISFNVSGFLFDRRYRDWDEERFGGKLGLGYRLTPDLSVSASLRGEQVDVHSPRVDGVQALDRVLGENDVFGSRFQIRHDTRDIPFAPTEGHLIELAYEQVFGDYDLPKFEVDYRKYFLIRERPDGSGRHTLSFSLGAGFAGADTPIFENYFAGGFSTLRGFDFRGASPVDSGVVVGGRFRMLGSVEYMVPLTADDMIKGVVFCDYGTVEENITIHGDDFRVAPGVGLRISIPALGPAPLAFDFAFPVAREDTDDVQNFSFFMGFGRG